jgi:hypothetical protein
MALSKRRAELVKDYLVSQGISADIIQVRADGGITNSPEQEVRELQAAGSTGASEVDDSTPDSYPPKPIR